MLGMTGTRAGDLALPEVKWQT
ncbi:hypothetical protein DFAR_150003 [Desulfarculales bacterium]